MDDKSILALFMARDQSALSHTQKTYATYCLSIAESILQSHADAEECVNDTYLQAWRSIPPHNPKNLRTYLGKLVRNIAINRLRASKRQKRNPEFLISLDELAECIPAPEETEDGSLALLLDGFLATCDTLDRKLFVGRYWYGRSVKTMAEGYGMTPNAVSIRLSRTREKLKSFLQERGYQP